MKYKLYKLKDICTIIAGQSPESKYYNSDGIGIPFFQGKADFGELYPEIRLYCSHPTKIAEKNDILLSVRAPVGPTNLTPCRVCIGRGLTAIRPSEIVNLKYLLYFFRYFEAQLQQKGTGTTFKAITQDVVKNIEVPIPHYYEQEHIVAQIEKMFSQLDSGIEALKNIKQMLSVYRQTVLTKTFATCCESKSIEQVCVHVTDGDHFPPPKARTGIPFIMISNIKNNQIVWENTKYVEAEYYNQMEDLRTPKKGDVLYTVTGSYGKPVLVDFEKKFCFQRHIALLRPNEKILQKYLYYVMQSPSVYQQATDNATGTAQKTVSLSVLRKISIPYCNLDRQKVIVSMLENNLTFCDSIEQTIDTTLQLAEAMRQSILNQAFEGRLV